MLKTISRPHLTPLIFTLFLLISPAILLAEDIKAQFVSENQPLYWTTLLKEQDVIWGFDFLSPTELIYTLKKGQIKVINLQTKKISSISGLPQIDPWGQGGLLDIRYHARSKKLYFTYAKNISADQHTTVLARAGIEKNQLTNLQTLLIADAASGRGEHFGSRIEFQGEYLFFSIGDRGQREKAQDLGKHNGKILRLTLDGKTPADNPFIKTAGAKPEIWSYGHRNPQGLAIDPQTNELWEAEFGPQGGDEINLIAAGKNYGWPKITYGEEYGGGKIAEGSAPGMEQPIRYYTPSISPSGIYFYNNDHLSKWKGNLFITNLSSQHLRRLVIDQNKIVHEEELMKNLGIRFRCVRASPAGQLLVSTDDGRIILIDKDQSSIK